jgi:hypothetical protein
VVDPQKAKELFQQKGKTYLVDQASDVRLVIPEDSQIGSVRSSMKNPLAGKEYFMIFANYGTYLKRGNKVTIVIGDAKFENLVIE